MFLFSRTELGLNHIQHKGLKLEEKLGASSSFVSRYFLRVDFRRRRRRRQRRFNRHLSRLTSSKTNQSNLDAKIGKFPHPFHPLRPLFPSRLSLFYAEIPQSTHPPLPMRLLGGSTGPRSKSTLLKMVGLNSQSQGIF